MPASKRWLVKIQDSLLQEKQLLVPEACLKFYHYAMPPDLVPEQPSTISIKNAGVVGNVVYAQSSFKKGKIIFTENPLMVVQNQNGFATRLNLYYQTRDEHGKDCATLKRFGDFSDGGITHQYKEDAKSLFQSMAGSRLGHLFGGVDEDEHTSMIAGVLARWQSNGHHFPLRGHHREGLVCDNSLSALYYYVAKLNHSCDPNTRLDVDSGTGRLIVYATRPIKVGEELTVDYIGHGPKFRTMSVEDRRALIRSRGFVCMCAKCLRESVDKILPNAKVAQVCDRVGSQPSVPGNGTGNGLTVQGVDRTYDTEKQYETPCAKSPENFDSESSVPDTESTYFLDEEDTSESPEAKSEGA